MNIIWVVNTIFPYPAGKLGIKKTAFGGWLNSLHAFLVNEEDIDLTIVTVYHGNKLLKYKDDKTTYYLMPGAPAIKYSKKYEKYWKIIEDEVAPDIVHLNGTEFCHGLAYINIDHKAKVLTSIQGMVSVYSDVYYGNISPLEIFKNITFRDIIRNDNLFQAKKKFAKRGTNEVEIIKGSDFLSGRTVWDYSNTLFLNRNATFFSNNRILRQGFYSSRKWNISGVERNTIFCSQASYPIKGVHYLIKALYFVKSYIPDAKLFISGVDITRSESIMDRIKLSGYGKYLKKLIFYLNLQESVFFTGVLNEKEMIAKYLKSHVYVQASAIENSPNSLGEAMMLGLPCIASYVGGTAGMLDHEKEGLLYTYTEPAILANYIIKVLSDDKYASYLGKNASVRASKNHDKYRILQENLNMYRTIYEYDNKNEIHSK